MIEQDLLEGNKYFKWYWSICNRAKDRVLSPDTYVEKHHIYPKSIYGQNKYLVKLTAKEHYIVHLLLWWGLRSKYGTYNENTKKMCHAFTMMNNPGKSKQRYKIKGSKEYSFLKTANHESKLNNIPWNKGRTGVYTEEQLEKMKGPMSYETKKLISEANKGVIFSEERKKNISLSKIGKKLSEEHKNNISKNHSNVSGINNPMYGKKNTKEMRRINSEKNSGENNAMYGKNSFDVWIEKYGIEYANKRKQQKIDKLSKIYIIQTPDNNIIEIISRKKVMETLECSLAFFQKKKFKDYKLLGIKNL